MPIRSWIDAPARIVRMHYEGEIRVEDLTTTMESVFKYASYRPGFGILIDRRNALPPTAEYMSGAIDFGFGHQEMLAGAPWAVVVSGRSHTAAARIGAESAARALIPQCVQIFEDIEAAEKWLRLTAEMG